MRDYNGGLKWGFIITIIVGYKIDYLIEREQNCLDTVILPYALSIPNINIPIRVKDDSKNCMTTS